MASRRVGEVAFSKVEKCNAELFTLTYGAIVQQILKDYEDVDATNEQLEKMGYNIGIRLIDEFLAKAGVGQCGNFAETADVIAKVGFKMFLGVTAEVVGASANEFTLQFADNPLADFVELPEQYSTLAYSNMLCGVLRGALEMVQVRRRPRNFTHAHPSPDQHTLTIALPSPRRLTDEGPVHHHQGHAVGRRDDRAPRRAQGDDGGGVH